jgi:hypothetical protein
MSDSPRFSVVIPTRDRAHTLRHTIRTCLAQRFDDVEILVSDNGSDSKTRGVVEEFTDGRLRYVHTPRPLAMTDSWEFAVSQAAGEFVTVIGDDDGLLLHALPAIDRILRLSGGMVLRWETAHYCWPCMPPLPSARPNRLYVPLRRRRSFHRVRWRASRGKIAEAARGKIAHSALPMIYRSMVHRSVLAKIREQTGRVFASRSPDVYSAFAVAHAAGRFLSVDAPIGLTGGSGAGNGLNVYLKQPTPAATDFSRLNNDAGIIRHELAPDVNVMSAAVADSFLHARERLFPSDRRLALDRRKLVLRCIEELEPVDELEWQQARDKLRASLIDDPRLVRWFDRKCGRMSFQEARREPAKPLRRYGGGYLNLDTSEFGVTNVFEAAELFERLLGYRTDGVDIRLVHNVPARLALIARRLSARLRSAGSIASVGKQATDGCT